MPYHDFRQFLDVLRQHGELVDINRPIALADVGKAMKQSYKRQGPGLALAQPGQPSCVQAGHPDVGRAAPLGCDAGTSSGTGLEVPFWA